MDERLRWYHEKFDYDDWANRRVLEALRGCRPVPERGRNLLAHIVGAQEVWLGRFGQGAPFALQVWPELSLEEIDARLEGVRGAWGMLLDQTNGAQLDEPLSYENLSGKPFSTPRGRILDHVLFHGAYHRGQIATQMRADGCTPSATDYIQYTRR